ncbi:CCA tRNA nucleotidyltransferase [Chloroflexota bacterium]
MKLCLENKTDRLLGQLSDFINRQNIDCYLVGGYIRDVLLDYPTQDIDIALPHALETAQSLAKVLNGKYVVLDEVNEVARVVFSYPEQDSHWHLDLSTLKGSIEENLSHRDFTINAMAVNLRELKASHMADLIDPFGGQKDIEAGLIRVVSRTAFQDDPARLLRAVRLAAECGFTIEEETEALIQAQCRLILKVAGERVREELYRLFSIPDSAPFLYYLDRLGLLTSIFSELEFTKSIDQPFEHYWDVFQHSLETVAALESLLKLEARKHDPVIDRIPNFRALMKRLTEVSDNISRSVLLKLAALLHDIAKPQTRSLEPNGRARFLGHTKEGAEVAGHIMQRLRFSNRDKRTVEKIVESHLRPWQMGGDGRPTHRAIYRFFRDTGESSSDIIALALADFLATRGPDITLAEWEKHCAMMEYILSEHEKEEARIVPSKLIDGHDLINIFGMKPGPRIGQLLESVHEAQGIGEVITREEAMAFARRQIVLLQSADRQIAGEEELAFVAED